MELPAPMQAMAGVVLALLLFSGLLLAGAAIVRWLGLATDLPEGPRFEPPAPPLVDAATPEQARAVAAVTHRRAALGAIARTCLAEAWRAKDQGKWTEAQAGPVFAAAQAVEAAWQLPDLDQAERTVREAEAAFRATLPSPVAAP